MRTCTNCGTPALTQRETCLACGTAFPPGTPQQPAPRTDETPHRSPTTTTIQIDSDSLAAWIGVVSSVVMFFGALMPWAGSSSSFKVPVMFLFDPHTRTQDPALGFFLVVVALLGALFALKPDAERARVTLGVVVFGTVILYLAQVSSLLHGIRFLFEDFVGWGTWFTLAGAIGLLASGLRAEWLGTRWKTAAAVSGSLFIGTWLVVTFALNTGSAKHLADLFVPASAPPTTQYSVPPLENPAACTLVSQATASSLFGRAASKAENPKTFVGGETSHCAWATDNGAIPTDHISHQLDVVEYTAGTQWINGDGAGKPIAGVGQRAIVDSSLPTVVTLQFVSNGKLVFMQYDSEPTRTVQLDAAHERAALIALAKRIAPNV